MSLRQKLMPIQASYDDDFWAYEPENFRDQEEPGLMAWDARKGMLAYVPSKSPLPLAPLEPALQALLDHAWQSSTPDKAAPRGAIPLASSRTATASAISASHRTYTPVPVTRSAAFDAQKNLAPHLKTAFAQDWSLQKTIPRVRAFAFRGDTRAPRAIKQAHGFLPPISRTDAHYLKSAIYPQFSKWLKDKTGAEITWDHFESCINRKIPVGDVRKDFIHYGIWRALVEREQFQLGRMLAEEALKGFISTTRATTVAKGYAKENGWVYVVLVDGGYLVPDKGAHPWTSIFGEQEIAVPGAVPWDKVQGFRQVGESRKFTGPVYLRNDFDASESDAAAQCHRLLSGMKQP
jgi:hypothetical protein